MACVRPADSDRKIIGLQLRTSASIHVHAFTADENGLRWKLGSKMHFDWSVFLGFDETPTLFLLYTSDPDRARLPDAEVVPKRAFSSAADLDLFRQLVASNIHPLSSEFRVLQRRATE